MSRVVMECDLLHPVGEVIFNALSTFDPNEQWPGTTWIRLKACGLFGVDENDFTNCYFSNHFAVDSNEAVVNNFVNSYKSKYNENPTETIKSPIIL